MFAMRRSSECDQCVRVIRCRDADRVDFFRLTEQTVVGVGLYRDALFVEHVLPLREDSFIAVAQRDHATAFDLEQVIDVTATAAMETDHRDADVFIGTDGACER